MLEMNPTQPCGEQRWLHCMLTAIWRILVTGCGCCRRPAWVLGVHRLLVGDMI